MVPQATLPWPALYSPHWGQRALVTLLRPAAWSLPCLDPVLFLTGFFRKGEPQECVCALCDARGCVCTSARAQHVSVREDRGV